MARRNARREYRASGETGGGDALAAGWANESAKSSASVISRTSAQFTRGRGARKTRRKKERPVSTDALILASPPTQPYLRIVPLGGCGEIGRNMTVIETNDDLSSWIAA